MIDFGWLNIGGLVFGLNPWILPVVNLLQDKKQENKNNGFGYWGENIK
ncbi:hypothetical protein V7075_21660 [Neobacillus drentensis]